MQLHIVLARVEDALIVVVHRHGKHDLGPLLADHIVVQLRLDLHGLGKLIKHQGQTVIALYRRGSRSVVNNAGAHAHALVADIAAVAGDQPVHQRLRLAAK